MTEMQTMVRTSIAVNGGFHEISQGEDIDDLKRRVQEAVNTPGTFVEFSVVGNRRMSILMGPRTQVQFSIETVQFDPRDDGNDDTPFGGFYDFETG